MKFLDRFLRDYRINVASRYVRVNDKILDIGCFDGYLFEKLAKKNIQASVGLDPLLKNDSNKGIHTLLSGKFPEAIPDNETFDCIVMLAVLEHIPREEQKQFNSQFDKFLKSKGRVIITVPSPLVDHILVVLSKLRLIDGMSLDEHYGFEIKEVFDLLDKQSFKLVKHKKFQFGLNNLFVFEKLN